MDFKDKRVMITGSSRGIGFGAAKAFLAEGARVAINGKTADSANAAMEKLSPADRMVAAPGARPARSPTGGPSPSAG